MKRHAALLLLILAVVFSATQTQGDETSAPKPPVRTVPKEKQTVLGLYATATEAYEKWKADPKNVKVLDVRTVEECLFVGHPTMAWLIPAKLQTYQWDAKKKLPMIANPDFLPQVKEIAKPTDALLVMCRSGGRSAQAVNLLAEAGFKNAYSIIDGMEGDVVDDADSVFKGKRMKNGWKNSGLPWTCDLDPEKMRLPAAAKPMPTAKPK